MENWGKLLKFLCVDTRRYKYTQLLILKVNELCKGYFRGGNYNLLRKDHITHICKVVLLFFFSVRCLCLRNYLFKSYYEGW